MSTTKLTLSVEKDLIQEAKKAAVGWHTSLSGLFARVLRAMISSNVSRLESSPVTRRASGLVQLPADKDDGDLVTEALASRYGAEK